MSEHAEQLAIHENEIADIKRYVRNIEKTQREILTNYHTHELDSVKYKLLVDELIKEKLTKRLARQAITDKLITSGIWGVIVIVATLAYQGVKTKGITG